ncbi:AimR family lysis-lysogeny pheromone receptor [Bacillus cereus group sp. BfR-BA-02570]|uniref:AimR family lysis-lysogeny pheromone receptor n=1 Tax=Bacillus cereus group sp. BfR-BA-02570 TaxID=3094890 RepID=UPI0029C22249|nr:AimR family lysis-lysogeny pheromone receptor [Bacillus cereus group sp. BfR-BA-02570]MDX5747210.1 AimR family lysis-lysogeny pheromone receptor [Bacillus cereus group sp. BfR-BA-02570]
MNQKVKKEDVAKKNTLVKFLRVLVDDIDFQKKSQEDIAKEIGISGGTFSKNLTGKSQFSFWNLIKLLNILYENDINKKRQMLFTFCSVTTSKKNVRIAMEYANAKGDLQLLKSLVDSEKKSSLAMNREWAYVYELVWLRSSGSIEKQKLLAKIEDRKGSKVIKTKEMKVLYGILTYYTMYDLKKYNSLFEYAGVLVPEVEAITDNFIKSSYLGRIKEGLAYAYLVQDNLEKSRSLCHEILDIENIEGCFHLLRASAFVYLAESYTFECYDSASRYIKESLKQLEPYYFEREKYRRQRILNTYAFIKLVNKKNLENIKIYHCAEKSLLEIVKGNYINAVNILNDLEKENGYLTPMQYCYLGIAKDDISLIEKSIMLFECEGDRFYCKFPKKIMAEFNKNGMIC